VCIAKRIQIRLQQPPLGRAAAWDRELWARTLQFVDSRLVVATQFGSERGGLLQKSKPLGFPGRGRTRSVLTTHPSLKTK